MSSRHKMCKIQVEIVKIVDKAAHPNQAIIITFYMTRSPGKCQMKLT